jgi:hypothetical protein
MRWVAETAGERPRRRARVAVALAAILLAVGTAGCGLTGENETRDVTVEDCLRGWNDGDVQTAVDIEQHTTRELGYIGRNVTITDLWKVCEIAFAPTSDPAVFRSNAENASVEHIERLAWHLDRGRRIGRVDVVAHGCQADDGVVTVADRCPPPAAIEATAFWSVIDHEQALLIGRFPAPVYWLGEHLDTSYAESDSYPSHHAADSALTVPVAGSVRYELGPEAGAYRYLTVTTYHERLRRDFCVRGAARCALLPGPGVNEPPTGCPTTRVVAFEHPRPDVTVAITARDFRTLAADCASEQPPPLPPALRDVARRIAVVPPQAAPEPGF